MQTRLDIPPLIHDALARGAALAISLSGGKDSQTMLRLLLDQHAPPAQPDQQPQTLHP